MSSRGILGLAPSRSCGRCCGWSPRAGAFAQLVSFTSVGGHWFPVSPLGLGAGVAFQTCPTCPPCFLPRAFAASCSSPCCPPRPSILVVGAGVLGRSDMILADSDTESAASVPQSEAVSSDRHEDDVSLHQNAGEDSDVDSVSVASGEAPAVPEVDVPLEVPEVRDVSPAIRDAFRRMDGCDVERIFLRRAIVMRTVPMCIRGPYRAAMRVALVEATSETHVQRARGWKLFLLLPRMLLSRPPRGGLVSQEKLRKPIRDVCWWQVGGTFARQ